MTRVRGRAGVGVLLFAALAVAVVASPRSPNPSDPVRTLEPAGSRLARIEGAFCQDRIPTPAILAALGARVRDAYPDKVTVDSAAAFHPLQALLPYLLTLDDRAALKTFEASVDGPAIEAFIERLTLAHRIDIRNGMALLTYTEPTSQVPAPYVSSMTQAGLAYLAGVAYLATGRASDLELARMALHAFEVSWRDGGVLADDGADGSWYLEYASTALSPQNLLYVLNGFLYSLDVLLKMQAIGLDEELPQLRTILDRGVRAAERRAPEYETGFGWTFYDRTGTNRATASYHSYQTILLRELGCGLSNGTFASIAQRWWSFRDAKLPYVVERQPDGSWAYTHLKGTYPHPYLRDEYTTRLVYTNASGVPRSILPVDGSAWTSATGNPRDQLNVERASVPAGVSAVDVWWINGSGTLGVTDAYRVDNLELPSSAVASRPIGTATTCDGPAAGVPLSMVAAVSESASIGILPVPPIAQAGGAADARICMDLQPGLLPPRLRQPLSAGDVTVTGPAALKPGEGLVNRVLVDVSPASAEPTATPPVVFVKMEHLAIDPRMYPYLDIRMEGLSVATMSVTAELEGGGSISRYTPAEGLKDGPIDSILNWESFPSYRGVKIDALTIRVTLHPGAESGGIVIGPLTEISGPGGLMSGWTLTRTDTNSYSATRSSGPDASSVLYLDLGTASDPQSSAQP